MTTRKKYSDAFKRDAVRMLRERGTRTVTEIARELGVRKNILHRWNRNQLAEQRASEMPVERPDDVERMRRRLRELESENALLKKVAALFAKDVK